MKKLLGCVLPLVVLLLATASDGAAVSRWRVHQETGKFLVDLIETVGRGDTWFFGERLGVDWPASFHWDGRRIREVPLPRGIKGIIHDVDFVSADEGWAVGSWYIGEVLFVLRWDGKAWKVVRRESETDGFPQVKALGGGAALVTGVSESEDENTEVHWKFDGRTWTEEESELVLSDFSRQYALGSRPAGQELLRWNGKVWTRVPVDVLPESIKGHEVALGELEDGPTGEIWMTVEQYTSDESAATHLLHWNGGYWSRELVPLPSVHSHVSLISSDGRGGLWLSGHSGGLLWDENPPGSPFLYHRLPSGQWEAVATNKTFYDMALVPGTTSLWAAGRYGFWDTEAVFTSGSPR